MTTARLVLALGLAACWVQESEGVWEAKVSSTKDLALFQKHQLAVAAVQDFDFGCERGNVPPEDRFELFASSWNEQLVHFRDTAQQIVGPISPADAIDILLSEMWWVYGYVPVPNKDIKAALLALAPHTGRWVDPYGGTGYFAMQLQRALNVDIQSWDRKPRHMQWLPMQAQNATTADYTNVDVFLLGYPCCSAECWAAVPRFTDDYDGRVIVLLAEPRGHYCASDEMWDYLCNHWDLRIAHRLTAGFPGAYHHLFVFTRPSVTGGSDDPCWVGCGAGLECECPRLDCYADLRLES